MGELLSFFAGTKLPPLDFSFVMGALGVAITLLAYAVLLRQIIWGTKRPSPVAWIGFGLCTGVGYLVQLFAGVQAGSWTMGVTALFCFIVGGASLLKGRRKTAPLDWISFALGLVTIGGWGICVWYKLDQTLAAVLATVSDLLLYIPLIRAGWSQPELDSRMAYFLNTVKFVPALMVTVPFTLATVLYSIALVFANTGMNLMLMLRESWLLGEMRVFYRVAILEFGNWGTYPDNPEHVKRLPIVKAAFWKIIVSLCAVYLLIVGVLYLCGTIHNGGELFACIGFGWVFLIHAPSMLFLDKIGYTPEGVSYSCPH